MIYISIDGDDIGQKISYCYLTDNVTMLKFLNDDIQRKVKNIADSFKADGYEVIFCAADGVAMRSQDAKHSDTELYNRICTLAGSSIQFSVGVGATLKEAYLALLYAKSSGKGRLCNFQDVY